MKLLKIYNGLEDNSENKSIIKKCLKDMVGNQYELFLVLQPKIINYKELKKFDKYITRNFPYFIYTKGKRIKVFRRFGFISYPFIVRRK